MKKIFLRRDEFIISTEQNIFYAEIILSTNLVALAFLPFQLPRLY